MIFYENIKAVKASEELIEIQQKQFTLMEQARQGKAPTLSQILILKHLRDSKPSKMLKHREVKMSLTG